VDKSGKWRMIGRTLSDALHEYARIVASPTDSMATLIESMLPHVLRRKDGMGDVKPSTEKQYRMAASELQHVLAEFRPDQVTHGTVQLILDAYHSKPGKRNRLLTVLTQVFDAALDRELVTANPCHRIKRLKLKARERLITAGEYAAIYAQAPAWLQTMMALCALTGQRVGDVMALTRRQLQEDGIHFTQQKTAKRLVVAWTPELREVVARAKALSGKVARQSLFTSRTGEPLKHQNVWRAFKLAASRAGVRDVTLHDLRALAATEAGRQGLDAQALMGHTDARTTRIYLRSKEVPVVTPPTMRAKK
jgi:integrase